MKTKPFNKERAIAGDPVVDTKGQRWEFVEVAMLSRWPLKFIRKENGEVQNFTNDGTYWHTAPDKYDLSMLDTTP